MATSSLRNQFAPTSTKTMKDNVDKENEQIASGRGSQFINIEEGLNKIRVFPKHPTEANFAHIRGVYWISVEVDGEMKRSTVNSAKIHGGFEKDPIDEYIAFVRRTLSGSNDKEDAAKIKLLTDYQKGLSLSSTWVVYGKHIFKGKEGTGLIELKKTVRDAMNDEAIIEDEEEAISVDPFTHPDTGLPVLVTYNKKPNKKKGEDYYKVQMSKTPMPMTDEELEMLSKLTPLSQLAMFTYGEEDFEKALEGLRIFDEENEINLIDTEEFQEIVTEMRTAIEEGATAPVKEKVKPAAPGKKAVVPAKKAAAPVHEEEAEEVEEEAAEEAAEEEAAEEVEDAPFTEDDEFTEMSRQDLIRYNANQQLGLKLLKSDTDDDIRIKIREAVNPPVEEEEAAEEVEEIKPVKKAVTPAKPVAKAPVPAAGAKKGLTLDQIKQNLAAKQGAKK